MSNIFSSRKLLLSNTTSKILFKHSNLIKLEWQLIFSGPRKWKHLGNIIVIKVHSEAKNFYLDFYLEIFQFPALWAVPHNDTASTAIKPRCKVTRKKTKKCDIYQPGTVEGSEKLF